ncbi:MAG: HIT domain-containing protein [Phycisphaerae bacterium]
MVDFNKNIWAPWRMEYIKQLSEPKGTCFLCRARDNPHEDEKNYLLYRGANCCVILNRFPYTTGHMLIAPYEHQCDIEKMSDEVLLELMQLLRKMKHLLETVIQAEGFNVGLNLCQCAGAGLPDHLHMHIVPRWSGDTNFMSVLDDVRVIPEALDKTYKKLKAGLAETA